MHDCEGRCNRREQEGKPAQYGRPNAAYAGDVKPAPYWALIHDDLALLHTLDERLEIGDRWNRGDGRVNV
jgi:hypothetical protein